MSKTIPGFVKFADSEPEIVSVVKASIKPHPINSEECLVSVVRGWKRNLFSKSGKFAEQKTMQQKCIYIHPGGFVETVLDPKRAAFFCGVRQHCHDDLMKTMAELRQHLLDAESVRDDAVQAVVDILENISQQQMGIERFEDFEKVWRVKLAQLDAQKGKGGHAKKG